MTQITANKAARDAAKAPMSAAEKVRRQIKAGHKPKTLEFPSLFGAMKRMCDEADRARELMSNAGLDPDDIHLALLYRVGENHIGRSPLPSPGSIGPFVEKFEQMGEVDFIGIMWWQTTPETRGKNDKAAPMWITEFADDKRTASQLLIFKNKLASMSRPN